MTKKREEEETRRAREASEKELLARRQQLAREQDRLQEQQVHQQLIEEKQRLLRERQRVLHEKQMELQEEQKKQMDLEQMLRMCVPLPRFLGAWRGKKAEDKLTAVWNLQVPGVLPKVIKIMPVMPRPAIPTVLHMMMKILDKVATILPLEVPV